MAMTKKHYEAFAKINRDANGAARGSGRRTVEKMTIQQAILFSMDNKNFDTKRFLLASGFTDKEAEDICNNIND